MLFQGNDMVNLYTLAAVDLTVGICIDVLLLRALRVQGMPIGYYGREPEYTRFVWNTMTTVAIAVTARCTSAIAAICMFPFVNNAYQRHSVNVPVGVTSIVLPLVYFGCRILLTDRFHQHAAGYAKPQEYGQPPVDNRHKIAECPIAIGGDSSEEENGTDGVAEQHARAACDSEEPAARDTTKDNQGVR